MAKLSEDLLQQARDLLASDPRKPKQASLRRAISAAYYALFHFLIEEATRHIVGASAQSGGLRAMLARKFTHAAMNKACKAFAATNLPKDITDYLGALKVPRSLRDVASAFVDLQNHRHNADYNVASHFTREEVEIQIEKVASAMARWRKVPTDSIKRAFLYWLLLSRE